MKKKVLAVVMAAAMAFSLAACGSSADKDTDQAQGNADDAQGGTDGGEKEGGDNADASAEGGTDIDRMVLGSDI